MPRFSERHLVTVLIRLLPVQGLIILSFLFLDRLGPALLLLCCMRLLESSTASLLLISTCIAQKILLLFIKDVENWRQAQQCFLARIRHHVARKYDGYTMNRLHNLKTDYTVTIFLHITLDAVTNTHPPKHLFEHHLLGIFEAVASPTCA